uniref:SANT domain-containing protein n=1 Tax=Trichobilharzia regenti TaxID=157069 RepID=A0AA85JVJ6_TRIRE|nr:unnamed protein product [Trichobilharzia regenti]
MNSVLTRGRLFCSSSDSDQDPFENAVIRVGDDFQANLPSFRDESPSNHTDPLHRGILMWRPMPENRNERLQKFVDTATENFGYSEEQALALLTWHELDFDRACADLENRKPVKNAWTDSERQIFFVAIEHYHKKFHKLKELFPNRSVKELILFYYLNKKIRQTLQEMCLYGTKWFCLIESGLVKPAMRLPPNYKSYFADQTYDNYLDLSDPLDAEIKRHLDMLNGVFEESDESDSDTENSALSTESDSEAEVYPPYLLADLENVEQQQAGDIQNNSRKDSVNPSRSRQRSYGKGRGSANTTVLSQYSLNLPTGDLMNTPNRLSARRHARFEEEIAAAAAAAAATASCSIQSNGANKDIGPIKLSSRRGILSKRTPYDSRTRLPPGVYYSHKEFLRIFNSTPEENAKEMDELNAAIRDLSYPLDERIKELAEKKKKLLDGISAFKTPEVPIVS